MSKILIDEAVVSAVLEVLEKHSGVDQQACDVEETLRQALADAALDKMAENERELGIQMQPTVPWSQELESVWAEPDEQPAQQNSTWCMKMNGCKTKCEDCPDEAIEAAHGITKKGK